MLTVLSLPLRTDKICHSFYSFVIYPRSAETLIVVTSYPLKTTRLKTIIGLR